jgi:glycosyltransferase involved in cell wall biosynthesis
MQTAQSIELVLLGDGPDELTQATLASLRGVHQLGTAAPLGPAACFNRLAANSDADVLVLLESGALVGPGWLDRLLAALEADARNGLAGPSTNRSWNEQAQFPRSGSTPAAIAAASAEADRRFGSQTRTLEPLYSLADFCYVVRRAVVDTIGAADEGYGLGPCWEMDYNIRAARAGWRGVWACAAYVHRAPFTARREREERLRFEAARNRYQDSFCALRLLGQRAGYEPHCRGDACEHFAPPEHIRLHLPLYVAERTTSLSAGRPATSEPGEPTAALDAADIIADPLPAERPLVTCIMPTRDRVDFVLQSLAYFQRQTYPNRELIIVDDGNDHLERRLPADSHIRYLRVAAGTSIGAKRNLACEHAHGTFIAQWDDDDWYGPTRLEAQIAPLLAGEASITGLTTGMILDLPRWEFWRCAPELHRRLFAEDVHGGTLVYRREVWERHARYPDQSLAEDAHFLRLAVRRGNHLRRLPGDDVFVYLRHASNSWAFQCGRYLDPGGWQRVVEPALPAGDRAFYAVRSPAASSPDPSRAPIVVSDGLPDIPLISCIMPTFNRRAFVPWAIDAFLRQSYVSRELIVLDDGDDTVADLIPDDPRVRYTRQESRLPLGAKRNRCIELARGELIMHWDDDDWHAPDRIALQATALKTGGAEICGLRQMLFFEPFSGATWLYSYPRRARPWLAGGSLLYTRALWRRTPFPSVAAGEDTRFVWEHDLTRATIMDDYTWYVALIHPANTSPKLRSGVCWHRWTGDLRAILGDDYDRFCHLPGRKG